MSPWLPRELRVFVGPQQVLVQPVQRTLTLRGLRRTLNEPHTVPCQNADGCEPWRPALQALQAALPGLAKPAMAATVIVSNHFLRYAVVPWRAELADAQEDLAYARHCFARVYGKEAALQWDIRLSHQGARMPQLASAVDAALPGALQSVLGGAGLALRSVQPHLMAVFNDARSRVLARSAWFALLEPGCLCLALLHEGSWSRVSTLRIGSAWREELPLMLERQAYLADDPAVPHEVYLWSAQPQETAPPDIAPWQFHLLSPAQAPAGASAQDDHPAMALAG